MSAKRQTQKAIQVCAHWQGMAEPNVYDMNPVATGGGLALNISREDNSQSLDLVRRVAPVFRIQAERVEEIISEVVGAVRRWRELSKRIKLSSREISMMKVAFSVTENL